MIDIARLPIHIARPLGGSGGGGTVTDEPANLLQTWEYIEALAVSGGSSVIYPIATNLDASWVSGASAIQVVNQRYMATAFLVNRTCTATGIGWRITANTTTLNNYTGGGLWQMKSDGGWTFLIDTGTNSTQLATGTGMVGKAFTSTIQLVPKTVYMMGIVVGFNLGAMSVVSLNGAQLNFTTAPQNNSNYFWNGGKLTVTTRQNADIPFSALQSFSDVHWMYVY